MSTLLIVPPRHSSFLLTLRVLLGLCFLLSPGISRAQTALPQQVSVAQAVQEAVDKNLNLLAERYNLTIADARIVTARLRPNPVLSVSGNIVDHHLYHSGTSPFSESVHIDVPFERGGKREYRTQVAENARGVAQLQLRDTIRTLTLDVQNAYQQYTTAQGLLQRIETEMLSQSRDVRQTIAYSYRRGQASFVEFLDAQRAFNDTMQSYNNARADYARSLYVIDAVSGRTADQ